MLLFHHDNRKFDEEDSIIGNHYDIRKNILERYQSEELFRNMSDVLYMTNRVRDSWDYENVYEVVPKGKVVKCHTHYSVVLCQEELKRCTEHFKRLGLAEGWSDNEVEQKYINLMYEAYMGNSSAASQLDLHFGYDYDKFEEYEWICQSAVVVRPYPKYHDCIDSVIASSTIFPLLDMVSRVKDVERDYKNSGLSFNWSTAVYDEIINMFNF